MATPVGPSRIRAASLMFMAILLSACGGTPQTAATPAATAAPAATQQALATPTPIVVRSVSLRTDIGFNGKHVPFLAGVQQGIYKKHGLDITVREGTGSATVVQAIANGNDDFGFVDGSILVQSIAKGVPVRSVTGVLQTAAMVILATPQSGIKTPADLNGKTASVNASGAAEVLFPAFAQKAGVRVDSVKKVIVDTPTRDTMLVSGQVDFSFNFLNSVPTIEERCKCTMTKFKYSDYGIDTEGNSIVASEATIRDKADVVRAFAAATVEAIEFAKKNPEKAVDDFFAYATKTTFSKKIIAGQWEIISGFFQSKATEKLATGCMATVDWQTTIDFMTQYGGVAGGAVTPAKVFTNEFLPGKCG